MLRIEWKNEALEYGQKIWVSSINHGNEPFEILAVSKVYTEFFKKLNFQKINFWRLEEEMKEK